jgi:hypothetical protein
MFLALQWAKIKEYVLKFDVIWRNSVVKVLTQTCIFEHPYAKLLFPKGRAGMFVSYLHVNDFLLQLSVIMAEKYLDRSESVEIKL